jgi:hypothetical protein
LSRFVCCRSCLSSTKSVTAIVDSSFSCILTSGHHGLLLSIVAVALCPPPLSLSSLLHCRCGLSSSAIQRTALLDPSKMRHTMSHSSSPSSILRVLVGCAYS